MYCSFFYIYIQTFYYHECVLRPGNICLVAEASMILYHKVICYYCLAFCMFLVLAFTLCSLAFCFCFVFLAH